MAQMVYGRIDCADPYENGHGKYLREQHPGYFLGTISESQNRISSADTCLIPDRDPQQSSSRLYSWGTVPFAKAVSIANKSHQWQQEVLSDAFAKWVISWRPFLHIRVLGLGLRV